MTDANEYSKPPSFDEEVATGYIGKYILVGVTVQDHEGNVIRHEQVHGTVRAATSRGITIALRGVRDGDTWNMPPDLRSIMPADPGTYTLRSTKEVVVDPDLLANWTVTRPAPKKSEQ